MARTNQQPKSNARQSNGTTHPAAEHGIPTPSDMMSIHPEQIINDSGAANADGIAALLDPDFDASSFEERAWLLEPLAQLWAKYAAEDTADVVDARIELLPSVMFGNEKEREVMCGLTGTCFQLIANVPYAALAMDLVDERGIGSDERSYIDPRLVQQGEAALREQMKRRATDMMQEAADLVVQATRLRAAAEDPLEVAWPSFWSDAAAPAGKRAA